MKTRKAKLTADDLQIRHFARKIATAAEFQGLLENTNQALRSAVGTRIARFLKPHVLAELERDKEKETSAAQA